MHRYANKKESKIETTTKNVSLIKNKEKLPFKLADNRPEAIAQRKLQAKVNNHPPQQHPIQKIARPELHVPSATKENQKENNTRLPDNLKSGIENLSGYSMDDVKVHYNSNKPAQLNAHAYAQGTNIHIASGQEKHLPHEAWHVVQQKQGRVKPTMQLKGKVNINDDVGLEKEADMMGREAFQHMHAPNFPLIKQHQNSMFRETTFPIQRKLDPKDNMPKELKKAIEGLNFMEEMGMIKFTAMPHTISSIRAMLKVLKESDYGKESGYDKKITKFIRSIEEKLPEEPTPVELKEKKIHSIWVQGDYTDEPELKEAIKTREKTKADEWLNLIWVYESSEKMDKSIEGLKARPIRLGALKMHEVDFRATILAWKDRPDWVSAFLEILDVLIEKKSFVAMSDIMRMIILYYQGGLYQDVKIKYSTAAVEFFDKPMVNIGKLQTAYPSRIENWAMIANAGSEMIEKIMEETLAQFPKPEKLKRLPMNYANDGKYSGAHVKLHENLGPWNIIRKYHEKVDIIGAINSDLKLENPRPINSWADNDGTDLNLDIEISGFNIVPVPDDGHCLFNAVCVGIKTSGTALRAKVASRIKEDKALREALYKSDSKRSKADSKRLDDMGNVGKNIVWGGNEEINVLSEVLKKKIVLHHQDGSRQLFDGLKIHIMVPEAPNPKDAIHICMSGKAHFDGMEPKK